MSQNPTKPRNGEPITLYETSHGEFRYRTVLDYAAPGSRRQQRRSTFRTLTEARAHVTSVRAQRAGIGLPTRDRETFDDLADEYLADRQTKVRPITYATYVSSLKRARAAFGPRPLGKIMPADIESLARSMANAGKSRRTVALTLGRVRAVLARAVRDGAALRNVADGIEAQGKDPKPRKSLTVAEYRKVTAEIEDHRLAAAWLLTLHGMRRSEVLGLRWQDVLLSGDHPSLTVTHGRTGASAALTPPKTRLGARTLPLTNDMAMALRALRSHLADSLGIVALRPEAFVVVDEGGSPVRPERYSDEWVGICEASIGRRAILHESRHTSVTVMRAAGVPDRIVAAWHGHDETIMRRTYDHAGSDRDAMTEAAEVLAALRSASA